LEREKPSDENQVVSFAPQAYFLAFVPPEAPFFSSWRKRVEKDTPKRLCLFGISECSRFLPE